MATNELPFCQTCTSYRSLFPIIPPVPVPAATPTAPSAPTQAGEDGGDHTIAIYGIDAVENLSAALERMVRVDTVAPRITITLPSLVGRIGTVTEIPPGELIEGTVSDGSGIDQVSALIIAADGTTIVEPIAVTNGAWSYVPSFVGTGDHVFRIQALDNAGNIALSPALAATASGVTYSVNVTVVGDGTVTPSSGSYAEGVVISLTATPANGFRFSGWSGAVSSSDNPLTLTMDGNKNITATFTEDVVAPVAADDAYSTDEDTVLTIQAPGVLGNDSGENALTALLDSAPTRCSPLAWTRRRRSREPDGQARFTGLVVGYGNGAVGLATEKPLDCPPKRTVVWSNWAASS